MTNKQEKQKEKKNRKNNEKQTKPETKTTSIKKITKDTKNQLKKFISEKTDEQIDLIINLLGKKISETKRDKVKKKTELMLQTQIEKTLIAVSKIGLQIREHSLKSKNFATLTSKEKFYRITDIVYKSSKIINIPKNVHAMDYLFQSCEDLLRDLFEIEDLNYPNYNLYVQNTTKLIEKLKKTNNLSKAITILENFLRSDTFYLIAQNSLQKLIKHYNFLDKEVKVVTKKEVDKYLEIYLEFAGIYEKILPLISTLIQLTKINASSNKKSNQNLYNTLAYVKRAGYEALVSGFDRNIRNSLAHRSFKIKIIEEKVEFIDRKKMLSLSFRDVQKRTRDLGSLLLAIPSLVIGVYGTLFLEFKKIIENLPD